MRFLSRASFGMTIMFIRGEEKGTALPSLFPPLIHFNTCHSEQSEESHFDLVNFMDEVIVVNELDRIPGYLKKHIIGCKSENFLILPGSNVLELKHLILDTEI